MSNAIATTSAASDSKNLAISFMTKPPDLVNNKSMKIRYLYNGA